MFMNRYNARIWYRNELCQGLARQHVLLSGYSLRQIRTLLRHSAVYDRRVERVVRRYRVLIRETQLPTYRQARQQTSLSFLHDMHLAFHGPKPARLRLVSRHWQWRSFFVQQFHEHREAAAFPPDAEYLNRGPHHQDVFAQLRTAQLSALRAELLDMMQGLDTYERLLIQVSFAVVCRAHDDVHGQHGHISPQDVWRKGDLTGLAKAVSG
ncbi:hypothetical protein KIH74_28750 [Kineosporia sp. J2-2]|uniref:Uncharacterized protein n=1 Tax=Kineosporia corallincola TaxID=2835133 RepID=A0ABS5TPD4_9ACTN|nr:hypothetical protein [Kineosporia corallincola]MBT0772967.1 hypothetical protein [Kineosporia corallincola]